MIANPKDAAKFVHTLRAWHLCKKCGQRYRDCKCEVSHLELPDKIHYARPWGYKGVMTLPDDHPDSPKRRGV